MPVIPVKNSVGYFMRSAVSSMSVAFSYGVTAQGLVTLNNGDVLGPSQTIWTFLESPIGNKLNTKLNYPLSATVRPGYTAFGTQPVSWQVALIPVK